MTYESTVTSDSRTYGGVRFTIRRMSFGRRLELARRVREAGHKLDFARAGSSTEDALEAASIGGAIDRLVIEWGLAGIEGLEIDGAAADAAALIERGPEELAREIAEAVKRECGLSEDERKN